MLLELLPGNASASQSCWRRAVCQPNRPTRLQYMLTQNSCIGKTLIWAGKCTMLFPSNVITERWHQYYPATWQLHHPGWQGWAVLPLHFKAHHRAPACCPAASWDRLGHCHPAHSWQSCPDSFQPHYFRLQMDKYSPEMLKIRNKVASYNLCLPLGT